MAGSFRVLREMWQQNPPSVVLFFGIVFFIAGYAYTMAWAYGVFIPAFGIALLLGGGVYEIVWLHKRRKTLLEP